MTKITHFLIPLFLLLSPAKIFSQSILINEILTSNSTANTDEDGSHEDWLELFNASNETVSLAGYGITDNPAVPFKWIFPDYAMEPGAHLLVWCSDKNRTNPTQPLHTNFKISADGETLRLSRPDGTLSDEIPPAVIPQNTSWGRTSSGAPDFINFTAPTPGEPNSGAVLETLSNPVFSVDSGFFDSAFDLTISHPDSDAMILYTLDGSEPKLENIGGKTYQYKNVYPEFPGNPVGELLEGQYQTLAYSEPISIADRSSQPNKIANISTTFNADPFYLPNSPIAKSTVVRARAFKTGTMPSKTVTRNYLVPAGNFALPVVAINTGEDLLFEYHNGIGVAGKDFDDWRAANPDANTLTAMANYLRSGSETEIAANMSLFKNGIQVFSQDVGMRIHGGFSRNYPSKSLRIYATEDDTFGYAFFDGLGTNHKNVILRNSGNDFYSTYLRDAFIQRISAHMHFQTQAYQPTIAFLNGEYWGMLDLRERYDKHYFKRVFDIDTNALDFLEFDGNTVQEGDPFHYSAMMAFITSHDLSDDTAYNYVATQMDPDNFIDFFIANIYARNTDWPHNNIEFWRKKTSGYEPAAPYGQDGRWRWVLKDTDHGFSNMGGLNTYEHNTLAYASSTGGGIDNPEWSTLLFRKLLDNPKFRNAFVNRFADLLNTAYLPERVTGILTEMKSVIEPEILKHGQRWKSINSMAEWNSNLNAMAEFAAQRPAFQRDHIREKFSIAENVTVSLDVSHSERGYIHLNSIAINGTTPGVSQNPYPWNGIYFKDIPIKLTAIPLEGYQFSYWSGAVDSFNPEITITPGDSIALTAHFTATSPVAERVPVYFWALTNMLPNITPLVSVAPTYGNNSSAMAHFVSCLTGYPFQLGHPDWRRASMERTINPTAINYLPQANNGIAYLLAGIMGIKIKQPFELEGQQNLLEFHVPTTGYANITMSFAAKNNNAADAMLIDYAVNSGDPVWITTGIPITTLPLGSDFALYTCDFTPIALANNNFNFKVRLRFAGNNLGADNGGEVIFNNVSVMGSPQLLDVQSVKATGFEIYPNPFEDVVQVAHHFDKANYTIATVEGRVLATGTLGSQIDLSRLSKGVYVLMVDADGKTEAKKLVKK